MLVFAAGKLETHIISFEAGRQDFSQKCTLIGSEGFWCKRNVKCNQVLWAGLYYGFFCTLFRQLK
jgi:hypothetical protein